MATRYIYLSDALNEKLKQEDNASQLIQKLLLEHYQAEENKQGIETMSPEQLQARIALLKEKVATANKLKAIEGQLKHG